MSKTEGPFDVRRACSKILIEQNRLERAAADANRALQATHELYADLVRLVRKQNDELELPAGYALDPEIEVALVKVEAILDGRKDRKKVK